MWPERTGDFAGRVQMFMDAYGAAGVALLAVVVALGIIYQLLRGSGLALLLLLMSYSLIFVQVSAINTAAFFVRALALGLLVLSVFRRFVIPGWAFWGMSAYGLLGLACAPRAPDVMWSLQNALLLLVTILALTVGLAQYLRSYVDVRSLFRMFVVAGGVWSLASLAFLFDFAAGRTLRFAGGGTVHATNYAASGALLLPFMLWAAIQRGSIIWRLLGIGGTLGIPIFLFLSGTRTAIVVGVLACAPLLLRGRMSRTARVWLFVGVLGVGAVLLGHYLVRDRDTEFLVTRLTSLSLTGRETLWATGLKVCLENALVGRGIGAHNTLATEAGISSFHNAYLSIWCNTGVFGLAFVLSVLLAYGVYAFSLIRRARDPAAKDAMRLAFGFLLAVAAMGIVRNSFASPSNAVIATLLIMVTLVNRVGYLVRQEKMHVRELLEPLAASAESSPWRGASPGPDRAPSATG